ncbi:MAG: type II toxin-antitoxin system death-on-curing family toxin [Kiritimatiellales bacterium]|nr:type II toxin-antitoxin system death-on-curing family toxin [Kiritimatiellota bacterium]MBL7011443.1 type II toxin-antitoxin system death-on-curing family toxin [Kiritimatiellales bacterium]
MKEPLWLTAEVILAVQEELLARFGGLEGLRNECLLDSALNRPQHLFRYEQPTLFEMAAAYAHGLVKNHPFLDGNKRISFMAAYIFLGANGHELDVPEAEAALRTLALAAGEISADEYAAWLKESCS